MKYQKSSKAQKNDGGFMDMDAPSIAISAAIALLTVAFIWLVASASPQPGGGMSCGGYWMMGGGSGFASLTLLLNVANIFMLSFLIAQYVTIYRRIKSGFTLGLIVLAYVLLAHSLMSSPILFSGPAGSISSGTLLDLMRAALTTIAAGVLLYLNSK